MNKLRYLFPLIFALILSNCCSKGDAPKNQDIPFLSVSKDGHYLLKEGEPFFWLGDTGWFLFTQPPEDVEMYLQNRVHHGFNTIQMMVTNKRFVSLEFRTNHRGDVPFINLDPVNSMKRILFISMTLSGKLKNTTW
jgi:hypothetical protein